MRGALMVLTNAAPENGLPQPLLPPSRLRGALTVPKGCWSGDNGPVLLLPPPLMRECCKGPGAHPELPLLSCRGDGAGSAADPSKGSPLPVRCPLLLSACKDGQEHPLHQIEVDSQPCVQGSQLQLWWGQNQIEEASVSVLLALPLLQAVSLL